MKKKKREGLESWGLVLVSAVFVITGIVLLVTSPDEPAMPIAAIVFFGACGVMGVTQVVEQRQAKRGTSSDSPLPVWAAAFASAMIAVACVVLLIALGDGADISFLYQGLAAPAALAGIVFFGGGAVYLAVRLLRSRREDGRSRRP